jgi:hypothetical protein
MKKLLVCQEDKITRYRGCRWKNPVEVRGISSHFRYIDQACFGKNERIFNCNNFVIFVGFISTTLLKFSLAQYLP